MSKRMKDFKKKLQENRGVKDSYKELSDKGIYEVSIPNKNLTAKIDINGLRVRYEEIKYIVVDLLNARKNINTDEFIPVSMYADVCYDLICSRKNNTEIYLKIC